MRFFRAATAAALAISLTATPVLAQSTAPLSVARAAAVTEDTNRLDDSGYLIPAAVIIAILAAAILFTSNKDDDDFGNPVSP